LFSIKNADLELNRGERDQALLDLLVIGRIRTKWCLGNESKIEEIYSNIGHGYKGTDILGANPTCVCGGRVIVAHCR
jgi:hypothetical protein